MDKIKIIRAPTSKEVFKKALEQKLFLKGYLQRMSYSKTNKEHRITIVFK